jgi:hypothetical protein
MSGLTDEQRARLLQTLREAPDPGGWRAGMDADDYGYLADALAPVVAAMLAEQRESIAAEIEAYAVSEAERTDWDGSPGLLGNWVGGIKDAARIARVGAA